MYANKNGTYCLVWLLDILFFVHGLFLLMRLLIRTRVRVFFVIAFERTIIGMWSGNEAFTFITIDEFFGMVGDINYYVCVGAKE